jgi:hypothetical protein
MPYAANTHPSPEGTLVVFLLCLWGEGGVELSALNSERTLRATWEVLFARPG